MNLRQVIESLGITIVGQSDKEYYCLCVLHNDNSSSMSFSKKKKLWTCYAGCGSGNLRKLFRLLKKKPSFELELLKDSIASSDFKFSNQNNFSPIRMPYGFKQFKELEEIPEYLLGRLNPQTIYDFKLGVCRQRKYSGYAIIPIQFNNRFVGYIARNTVPEDKKRYLIPFGFGGKKLLFNYDNVRDCEEVILVEGTFSCMSMVEKGFKNCMAVFAAGVSKDQVSLLLSLKPKLKRIVICFDRDSKLNNTGHHPGQHAATKAYNILKRFFEVKIMVLPLDVDPADASKEVLIDRYKRLIDKNTMAMMRIKNLAKKI